MTVRRVAVIGGGLAGLAATLRLQQRGVEVTLFERESDVGGVVRTVTRDGWTLDTGPAMAAEPSAVVRELLDAAGLQGVTLRAEPAASSRFIVLDGAPVVLPRTTAEFSSSTLLSIAGRLRLLKERLIPRSPVPMMNRSTLSHGDDSGQKVAERMFDPLVASTCAGDSHPDRRALRISRCRRARARRRVESQGHRESPNGCATEGKGTADRKLELRGRDAGTSATDGPIRWAASPRQSRAARSRDAYCN